MSRLDNLLESDDLVSLLSHETEHKPENSPADDFEIETPQVIESDDFEPAPVVPGRLSEPEQSQPSKPYDARRNAQSLVNSLQLIDVPLLSIAATLKLRSTVGGRAAIKKMREAVQKENKGEELTEIDERLIKAHTAFEKKLSQISDKFSPSPARTERLVQSALPFCEESEINVSPIMGFLGGYFGELITQFSQILLS